MAHAAQPLLLTTSTTFRQRACGGSQFNQRGAANIVFRDTTFLPLPGCDDDALESNTAFGTVTAKGCGEKYVDSNEQAWDVCSSTAPDACTPQPVAWTALMSLTCQCPWPEVANPAAPDSTLAPYLPSGGCVVRSNAVMRLGLLLPMFATEAAGFGAISWSPRAGAYQALQEINNKSDGVADDLLPNTQLRLATTDSKCDSAQALMGALHLIQNAFNGQGVNAIIGAGCSSASESAAQ
eukprot:4694530-Prymnesium_polylepis.1